MSETILFMGKYGKTSYTTLHVSFFLVIGHLFRRK